MIRATAPAKVILFGEHAVVYGEPAIAVPVSSLRAEASAEFTDEALEIVARDLNNKVIRFDVDDPLAEVVRITLKALDVDVPKAQIRVQSQIPIASGLGSGAAIAAVIVRVLAQLADKPLNDAQVNEIVFDVEKLHHGTPSGIDNTVIVHEQSIYFVRDTPIRLIENREAFTLVVADTGQKAPTKVSVGDVRRLYMRDYERVKPLIRQIGSIVKIAKNAMQTGNLLRLGQLMTENHALLQQITVSSSDLDALVSAAVDAGALGAKLSGGGRGGNMIALVDDKHQASVEQALRDAGAVQVFATVVESTR